MKVEDKIESDHHPLEVRVKGRVEREGRERGRKREGKEYEMKKGERCLGRVWAEWK